MRILIAPDKFKGTLSAREVANAIATSAEVAAIEQGVSIELDLCPVADGGEGFLDAIRSAVRGEFVYQRLEIPGSSSHADARWMVASPGAFVSPFRLNNLGLRGEAQAVGASNVTRVIEKCFTALFLAGFPLFGMLMLGMALPSGILVTIGFLGCAATVLLGFAMGVLLMLFRAFSWATDRMDYRKGQTAFIESAEAVGMARRPPNCVEPGGMSTRNLGHLIERATELGCESVIVGLGGSASVDGGIGVASQLGWKFAYAGDRLLLQYADVGANLERLCSVKKTPSPQRARKFDLTVLCDVSNPLLGPNGAARVYGPQKGATPEQVERLEAGLENLVKVCRECGIPCDPDQPGAGAAGGLGFGLATFLGATLTPGAPFILDLIGFNERAERADLIITGEGRLDSQTASGKAVAEVARRAAELGKPCIAVVGSTEGSTDQIRAALAAEGVHIDAVASAADAAGSRKASLQDPAKWVQEAGRRAVNEYLSRPRA